MVLLCYGETVLQEITVIFSPTFVIQNAKGRTDKLSQVVHVQKNTNNQKKVTAGKPQKVLRKPNLSCG